MPGTFAENCFTMTFLKPAATRLTFVTFLALFTTGSSNYLLADIPASFQTKQLFLSGSINHFFNIQLHIKCVSDHWKGSLRYVDSSSMFSLSGALQGNSLQLIETDSQKNITGFIELTNKGNSWSGFWYNFDRSIRLPLFLCQQDDPAGEMEKIRESPLYQRYSGIIANQNGILFLQSFSPGKFKGRLLLLQSMESFTLENQAGTSPSDESHFLLFDQTQLPQGKLAVNHSENGSLLLNLELGNRTAETTFFSEENIAAKTLVYASYQGGIGLSIPSVENEAFQTWFESLYEEWFDACNKNLNKESTASSPASRNQYITLGWTNLYYFNKRIISGLLFLQNPLSNETEIQEFNFDLNTNLPIHVEKLFLKKPGLKTLCEQYSSHQLEKIAQSMPQDFETYLDNTQTSHFILSQEGIRAISPFHPFFGKIEMLLPAVVVKKSVNDTYWNDLFFEPYY